jgi:DNA polymerase
MTTLPALHCDFETRSTIDIKECGAYVYAQHPSTDVHCMAYAFGDGEVHLWKRGEPIPPEIENHILLGGIVIGHNSQFERLIFTFVMGPRYGWPVPDLEQWRCTMVMGYAMALPGALEHIGPALSTGFEKDMTGHRLMLAMSKPRRPRKGEPKDVILWKEDPESLEKLYAYCRQDVEAERAADKRLVRLRPLEQTLWQLDQTINDRGVGVDVDLAKRNLAIVDAHSAALDRQMAIATDYEVTAVSNVNQLKAYLKGFGVFEDLDNDSLAKGVIEEILARANLDPRARRALELRREGGKASVSKIDALLNGLSLDGRKRAQGLTQFHAASTGRWGGRRFQPQNIVKPDEEFDIDGAIEVILKHPTAQAMQILDTMYGDVIECISYTLRGMVKADDGNKIIAADFSGIESRVLAWLAGERWKLDYFARFDQGLEPDIYIKTYCEAFNVEPFGKKDPRRQAGKVMELASGFQGGHGAYLAMIPNDAVLASIVAAVKEATTPEQWSAVEEDFDGRSELPIDTWVALKILINRWRLSHPETKTFWTEIEDAALRAVANPGTKYSCGPILFKMSGSFLWCQLPSGRALCYPYAKIYPVKMPWGETRDAVTFKTVPNVSNRKKIIHADSTNTHKWARISTYGGSLTENVTQATARDLLAEGMLRLEKHGYPIVLHVHDEAVAEVPEGFGSVEEFEQIMCELPAWATGLPIAASGFESERYRK